MATYNPFSQRLEESGLSVSNGNSTDQIEQQIEALQAQVADLEASKAEKVVTGVYKLNDDGLLLYNTDQSLYFELTVGGAVGAETTAVEQPGQA